MPALVIIDGIQGNSECLILVIGDHVREFAVFLVYQKFFHLPYDLRINSNGEAGKYIVYGDFLLVANAFPRVFVFKNDLFPDAVVFFFGIKPHDNKWK